MYPRDRKLKANLIGVGQFHWLTSAAWSNLILAERVDQWMQWKPLAQILKKSGYEENENASPQKTDLLVFSKKGEVVHASYYLGEGLYLEKPGQDFYEPYRIGVYKKWKSDWKGTSLSIWRVPQVHG